jgi:hypothetical protein
MSQFTAQELEEFEFRQRAEQELAASKQTESAPPSPDAATEAVNQVMMGGAGAAVGAAAGPVINAGAKQAQRTSIAKQMGVNPADLEWDSAGQKWARKTGFGAGEGKTVQEVNEEFKRIQAEKNKPVGRGKIASKMTGPYNVEKAAELADAETARQARFAAQRQAEMDALKNQQTAAKAPRGFKSTLTAPMGVLGRGAVGLGAGLQGSDALNRYNAGDTSGSVISGIGALGTAAAMIPHPVTRIGGTAIGLGAEGLNTFLDYLKKKSQKPAQPQAQPQQPQQMAEGGSAKKKMSKAERAAKAIRENNKKKVPQLADGGQVPTIGAVETLPVKFGMEPPNSNPYGFTAPSGPSTQALVPYYNKATGESWTAPSGGYTPPSADWFQGSPDSSQITPMPGFAPGMDPVTPYMPQRAPNMIATEDPEFYKRAAEEVRLNSMPQRAPTGGVITEAPPSQSLLDEIRGVTTPPTNAIGSGLGSLTTTNAPKPVAPITPQQPFQQRRVAPPLSGNINPSFAKRALPYKPKAIPKPMPRRRMFAEGGSTTPAWQRSEGKSPSGGLNALGRASYKRETGGELKAPQPEGGSRKKSFCARMGGMKKKLTSSKTANDPDSRINKALRKWKC